MVGLPAGAQCKSLNSRPKGNPMKRDMDIVRRIALETSSLAENTALTALDGIDKATFAAHVIWMEEAELITANIQEFVSGEPPKVRVRRLTWAGCDFADAVRSDTLWNKAKEVVIKPAASFTFALLKEWLVQEIKQGFPTLRK